MRVYCYISHSLSLCVDDSQVCRIPPPPHVSCMYVCVSVESLSPLTLVGMFLFLFRASSTNMWVTDRSAKAPKHSLSFTPPWRHCHRSHCSSFRRRRLQVCCILSRPPSMKTKSVLGPPRHKIGSSSSRRQYRLAPEPPPLPSCETGLFIQA